jgi:hypothetical protein
MSTPPKIGDDFPLEDDFVGDCTAEKKMDFGLPAMCVLDPGHDGPHVATDGKRVIQVWK